MTKFAPFARVFRCDTGGETGKIQVDTPEGWHTVCPIFSGAQTHFFPKSRQTQIFRPAVISSARLGPKVIGYVG